MKPPSLQILPLAALLLASVLVHIPGVPATPPDGTGPPDCPGFRSERGLGDVCPRANGLLEVFHPGNHRSVGFTHGLDPAPDGNEPSTPAGPKPPNCVSGAAGTYHIKVFYARAFNDVDNYASTISTIRSLVDQANGLVNDAAVATGGTASLNVKCTSGIVDVINAVLPTPMASASFSTIVTDLNTLGYTDGKVKHWVYYDDTSACTCGGTGHIYSDDTLDASNLNNGNGAALFAVTFGYNSARIMMHEMGHNLGAVQDSAPHSTLAGHCYDGRDTMCYDDGGPNGGLYDELYCGIDIFDCGKDDYFHINPTFPNYLATHWNIGNAMNRFLLFGRPTMTTLTCPASVQVSTSATCSFIAADDSSGVYYTVTWGDGATTYVPASGYVPPGVTQSASHTYTALASRTVTVTATDNAGLVSPALTRVIDVVTDATGPVLTVLDPALGFVYYGCTRIGGTSSSPLVAQFIDRGCVRMIVEDPESGIARVRLIFWHMATQVVLTEWVNPTETTLTYSWDLPTTPTRPWNAATLEITVWNGAGLVFDQDYSIGWIG